jgi:hypothetical protein
MLLIANFLLQIGRKMYNKIVQYFLSFFSMFTVRKSFGRVVCMRNSESKSGIDERTAERLEQNPYGALGVLAIQYQLLVEALFAPWMKMVDSNSALIVKNVGVLALHAQ